MQQMMPNTTHEMCGPPRPRFKPLLQIPQWIFRAASQQAALFYALLLAGMGRQFLAPAAGDLIRGEMLT